MFRLEDFGVVLDTWKLVIVVSSTGFKNDHIYRIILILSMELDVNVSLQTIV